MNKFLDQILNPPSVIKRKSLSQRNTQQVISSKKQTTEQQLQKIQNARLHSQSSNIQQQYEIQEIQQQVIFDHDHQSLNNHLNQVDKQSKNQKITFTKFFHSKSLPNQQQQYYREQNYHQNYKDKNEDQPLYIDDNKQMQGQIYQQGAEMYSNQKIKSNDNYQNYGRQFDRIQQTPMKRSSLNQKGVQNLINSINQAKLTQKQLQIWFMNQKYQFSKLFEENMILIQKKVKEVVQKVACQNNSKNLSSNKVIYSQQKIIEQTKSSGYPSQLQSSLSQQKKWQIQKKLIKQQLQQRYQYRIQKLEMQLQEQRKFAEQRLNQYQNKGSYINGSPRSSQTFNNYHLVEQLEFVKKQLEAKQTMVAEMQKQNENLNQRIFDIQQQIEGIQLEVQNRVREKLKQYQNSQLDNSKSGSKFISQNRLSPNQNLHPILQASARLQQSSKLQGSQYPLSMNQRQIQQLTNQNIKLRQFLRNLQNQIIKKQQQIKQAQKINIFREQQIKKNQEDLNFEWSELQRQRHSNLLRQQELTIAQQNISRKISQIRIKQQELQKWDIELKKKYVAIQSKEQQLTRRIQQIVQKQNNLKILEKQNSFKIEHDRQNQSKFIKIERQNYQNSNLIPIRSKKNIHDFNTEGGGSFRQNGVQIPQLAIGRKYQDLESMSRQQKSYNLNENQYQFRPKEVSKYNQIEDLNRSYNTQNRSNLGNYRQKQKMTITSNNFRTGRGSNQYVLPQSSKHNNILNHSRSKSRSKQKNLVRNFNNPTTIINNMRSNGANYSTKGNKYMQDLYQNKHQSNLNGLGSKLQRLRDEIKRQIDSIK